LALGTYNNNVFTTIVDKESNSIGISVERDWNGVWTIEHGIVKIGRHAGDELLEHQTSLGGRDSVHGVAVIERGLSGAALELGGMCDLEDRHHALGVTCVDHPVTAKARGRDDEARRGLLGVRLGVELPIVLEPTSDGRQRRGVDGLRVVPSKVDGVNVVEAVVLLKRHLHGRRGASGHQVLGRAIVEFGCGDLAEDANELLGLAGGVVAIQNDLGHGEVGKLVGGARRVRFERRALVERHAVELRRDTGAVVSERHHGDTRIAEEARFLDGTKERRTNLGDRMKVDGIREGETSVDLGLDLESYAHTHTHAGARERV